MSDTHSRNDPETEDAERARQSARSSFREAMADSMSSYGSDQGTLYSSQRYYVLGIAAGLLAEYAPVPGETTSMYLIRIRSLLSEAKRNHDYDLRDDVGAAAGAFTEAEYLLAVEIRKA